MHNYIFHSNDSYQIWIWLSVRNWNLDTSIIATSANFVSSVNFSGFCVLELSLIQYNRRVHKFLRHNIWTKSIWHRVPVRSLSLEVFLLEDLKIQTIGLSIFTASDSGVQSRPLIWIFLVWCLGLCKGVWGELHSSKHCSVPVWTVIQLKYLYQEAGLTMYSTETAISSSFHWLRLNSWSELQQYVLRSSNPTASLHLQKRHTELDHKLQWWNFSGQFFLGFLRLQSLEFLPFPQALCVMYLKTSLARAWHLPAAAGFLNIVSRGSCVAGPALHQVAEWLTVSASTCPNYLLSKEWPLISVKTDVFCAEKEGAWPYCIGPISMREEFLSLQPISIQSGGEGLHFL